MIEIAICAMQESLAANGDTAPAGSWDPPREPIPDAGELAKEMEARLDAESAGGDGVEAETDGGGGDEAGAPGGSGDAADAPPRRAGGATEGA
jgi:hypothetical protein